MSFDFISLATMGGPSAPEPDKPWYSDAAEVGRQGAAGLVVDTPRMLGQAARWAAPDGSAVDDWGRRTVESADERAQGWEPDMQGRGGLASTLIKGARAVGPMGTAIGASMLPGGQWVGPAVAAAQFGMSSAQDTEDKLRLQGIPDGEATAAGWRVGGLQGPLEGLAMGVGGMAFRAAKPLLGVGAKTTAGLAARMTDTAVLKPLAKGMALNLLVQNATELVQDQGTEFIERSYGAEPEDAWEIAKDSMQGATGLTLLLGPFAAGAHASRAGRAKALKDALYSPETPEAVRAQARDLIVEEATKQRVAPADMDAWLDEQFTADDARFAQQGAVQEAARPRLVTEPAPLIDLINGRFGLDQQAGRKGYAKQFAQAADAPSGQFTQSAADGTERQMTALEALQRDAGILVAPEDLPPPPPPPSPQQQRLAAVRQVAAETAQREQQIERSAREEFGITKPGAITTFGDLDTALVDGLIDDAQFARFAGLLAGNANKLGEVRKALADARRYAEGLAEQKAAQAESDAQLTAEVIARVQNQPAPQTREARKDQGAAAANAVAPLPAQGVPAARSAALETPGVAPTKTVTVGRAGREQAVTPEQLERKLSKATASDKQRMLDLLGYELTTDPTTGAPTLVQTMNPRTFDEVAAEESARTGKPITRQAMQQAMAKFGITQEVVDAATGAAPEGVSTESLGIDPEENGSGFRVEDALSKTAGQGLVDDGTTKTPKQKALETQASAILKKAEAERVYLQRLLSSPEAPNAEQSWVGDRVQWQALPDDLKAGYIAEYTDNAEQNRGAPLPQLLARAQGRIEDEYRKRPGAAPVPQNPAMQDTVRQDTIGANVRELLGDVEAPNAQADWGEGRINWSDLPPTLQAEWVDLYIDNLRRNEGELDLKELDRDQRDIESQYIRWETYAGQQTPARPAGAADARAGGRVGLDEKLPRDPGVPRTDRAGDGADAGQEAEVVVGRPNAAVAVAVKKKRVVAATPQDTTLYSASEASLPANPLPLEQVEKLVQQALAGVRGAPPVEVVARPADIGLTPPPSTVAYGVTVNGGDIYVFQSAMGSELDVLKTLFHELFHRGVRVLVPPARYVQTMLELAKSDARIQKYAIAWKKSNTADAQRAKLVAQGFTGSQLTGQFEALAVEEALADVAEEIKAERRAGTRFQSTTVRSLATWLAKVADLAGMQKLAQSIRAMTYTQAERFVMDAIDRSGEPVASRGGMDNLSARQEATYAPTQTEAFKRWFGDSRVVDAEGKPLVVYHGTTRGIPSSIGTPYFYMTESRAEARSYAGDDVSPRTGEKRSDRKSPTGEVGEFYVSLQNPVVLPRHQRYFLREVNYLEDEIAEWKAKGHDGVIMPWEGGEKDGVRNFIAFRPEQIKSATGNRGNFDPANADIRFRSAPTQGAVQRAVAQLPKPAQSAVRASLAALGDWTSKALDRVVFTGDLVQRAANAGIPSAKTFEALVAERGTRAREMEREVERIADMYVAIPEADRGTGPQSVNQFLFDSTREGMWGFGKYRDPEMGERFDALSPQSQAFVRAVLAHGDKMLAKKKQTVLAFTASEYDLRIAEAKKAGDDKELATLTKAKEADLAKFKRLFSLREGLPYAPIKRMGTHAVVAKSAAYRAAEEAGDEKLLRQLEQDADHYHVSFTDGKAAARALAEELRAQGYFGTDAAAVDFFEREKFQGELFGGDSVLLALTKLRSQVDARAASGEAGAAKLRDMVSELYLEALAEGSARKSEMRRRGVSGEVDMLRSFAAQGRADAGFVASVESNPRVQETIQKMRAETRQGGGRERKSELFNELMARHLQSLDVEHTPVLNKLTRMSSIWFLATSPAYYLQNLTQPWMMSLPAMAGKHGYRVSSAALFDAYTQLGPVMKSARLFNQQFDFDLVPADVRGAIKDLADQGRIDIGLETEMGEFQVEGSGALKDGWNKVDKGLRLLVQKGESINRLSTAIAAYRLELARTDNHAKAVEYAGRVLDDTHGNYGRFNAPRAFNTRLGKVALQFRKFQLIQLSFYGKLIREAFTGQERAMAAKALAYSLGHTGLMAGIIGLPGYAAVAAALGLVLGGDDEKFDLTYELRKMIGDEALANLLLRGAPTLAGVDFSGKVGAGTMLSLMPFSNADLNTQGGLAEAAGTALGGASLGMAARMLDGAQLMLSGDWYKGIERFLPKGFSDILKAYRVNQDGLTRRNGDVILPPEEVSALESVMQSMGLLPSEQAEVYERRERAFQTDKRFSDRSTRIKNDYVKAAKQRDAAGMRAAMEAWTALQAARAANGYTRQPVSSLLRAPREQAKREAGTAGGVQYNRSNRGYVQEMTGR